MGDAGVVIVVLFNITLVLTSLERIATPLIAVSKAMVAACEFFTVIYMPKSKSGSERPDFMSHDIVFDRVTFAYPSRPEITVLDALSLRIQSGRNTALVGPSGSGKSTIVGLLERWYSLGDQHAMTLAVEDTSSSQEKVTGPRKEAHYGRGEAEQLDEVMPKASGSIIVGGYNLEDLESKWWRSQIGLVQQEPFLFNDTIYGNVAHGLIGSEWEDEPVEEKRRLVETACHEAFAHEFINRLPEVNTTITTKISVVSIFPNYWLICVLPLLGLQYPSGRWRCKALGRPEAAPGHCQEHYQETFDHHP